MGNIYEELERLRPKTDEESHSPENKLTAEGPTTPPVSMTRDLSLEQEMTALYDTINSLLPGDKHRVIQFISAQSGAGTSSIIQELAKVIAAVMGRSVLLLDMDRRHSNLRTFFECLPSPDPDEVVEGTLSVDRAIWQVEGASLFVSPLFQDSALTPQELGSSATDQLWARLRQRFEYVLVDSPSISTSSDGLAIVRKVDGIVFVVEAEKTRWPVALAAKKKIVSHGGNILGMVFNKRRFYTPGFVYKRI